MWVEVKKAANMVFAQMWKEYLEEEGIPVRLLPDKPWDGELSEYRVLVSSEKVHVVEEVLKRL
jgi:hypothetical protein